MNNELDLDIAFVNMNDYTLLSLAVERMERYDPATLISESEMDQEPGISQEELDAVEEAAFE